jgi:parvulin-like peptidyl-prolyl isomerase
MTSDLAVRLLIATLAALAVPAHGADAPRPAATAPAAAASVPAAQPFAVVGDTVISAADFQRALATATRKKYYHAKPPEGEYAKFQREVGDDVVNRVLLLAEARRRGIQPDRDRIKTTVDGYESQYKDSAQWKANRERMLAAVVPQLESESLLQRLETLVRQVGEPADGVARAYYEQNKSLFVEPEQVKLSIILLKVDPSSRQPVWDSALAEAQSLHRKLVAGADFADLARLHSGDRSAAAGGAMDYTHRGMLPEAVHGVVDKMAVGALAEPVKLLEGYVLMRLDGRRPAQQRTYEQVRARAADLWQRAEGDTRWKNLIADLRRRTPVRVDESLYAPLPPSAEKPRAG